MPLKKPSNSQRSHPPIGTRVYPGEPIGTLELVEILGVGGYGVVYRAVRGGDRDLELNSRSCHSFAVKCLLHSSIHSSRERQHDHERSLHQYVSEHPNIVTLISVLEEPGKTYMVMEYAPDHDLFTQILNERRYLGNSELIKAIFLQVLDAVEHCHKNGIYHRDLKPENILCFDGGRRVALTDFGLATRDSLSSEFRTGSVFHMSPGSRFLNICLNISLKPEVNDVWSLGIILLNLVTGRNPWRSAARDDVTFQAYLYQRHQFFPSVLPVSAELNNLLLQVLDVHWERRISLDKLRRGVLRIQSLYSETTIFKDNLAQCHWETGKVPKASIEPDRRSSGMSHMAEVTVLSVSSGDGHFYPIPVISGESQQPKHVYDSSRNSQWPIHPEYADHFSKNHGDYNTSALRSSLSLVESQSSSTFEVQVAPFNDTNYNPVEVHYDAGPENTAPYFGDPSQDMLGLLSYSEPQERRKPTRRVLDTRLSCTSSSQVSGGVAPDSHRTFKLGAQYPPNGAMPSRETTDPRKDTVFGFQLPWSRNAWRLPF